MNFRKGLITVLAGLAVFLLFSGMPATANDESTTDAKVEVLPGEAGSYGASVIESKHTLFPSSALEEPDGWGAFIFWNGYISIRLEGSVPNATTISIWASSPGGRSAGMNSADTNSAGSWSSNMKIYVSADGRKWKQVGSEKVASADFLRYDFSGSFGDVKYIKVSRSGGRWLSFLRLDAVYAKGGDKTDSITNGKKGNLR